MKNLALISTLIAAAACSSKSDPNNSATKDVTFETGDAVAQFNANSYLRMGTTGAFPLTYGKAHFFVDQVSNWDGELIKGSHGGEILLVAETSLSGQGYSQKPDNKHFYLERVALSEYSYSWNKEFANFCDRSQDFALYLPSTEIRVGNMTAIAQQWMAGATACDAQTFNILGAFSRDKITELCDNNYSGVCDLKISQAYVPTEHYIETNVELVLK